MVGLGGNGMGQYYKAYVDDGVRPKVFSPDSSMFMTVNDRDEIFHCERSWDLSDPKSYGSLHSGLKLMEHSWLDNDFVNGVLESIWGKPSKVAWVGDYAHEDDDFDWVYTEKVYESVWVGTPDEKFDKVPKTHGDGYLVNLTTGRYIDMARYAEAATFKPSWDSHGGDWCIHPLPLLTAIGNGRGGGDYGGSCEEQVGLWAMDEIMYTQDVEKVRELYEVEPSLITFKEDGE